MSSENQQYSPTESGSVTGADAEMRRDFGQRMYEPIAALKTAFRKRIVLMVILPTFLVTYSFNERSVIFHSILLWALVAFCASIILFSVTDYRLTSRLENASDKGMLRVQLQLLKAQLRSERIFLRIAFPVFIVLAEITPYLQHYQVLDKWHAIPLLARCGAYAVLLIIIFIVNPVLAKRRYGRHIGQISDVAG